MRVKFGKECIGCGACVAACPQVFEFDTDLYQAKINPAADPEQYADAVKEAASICPVENIQLD